MLEHSSYLRQIFDSTELELTVKGIDRVLRAIGADPAVSAIAFRGNSGAGVAYPLACNHKWPLICVRKQGENDHGNKVEASRVNISSYYIVDDFISSGYTMNEIISGINCYYSHLYCAGIIEYYYSMEGVSPLVFPEGRKPINRWGAKGIINLYRKGVSQEKIDNACKDLVGKNVNIVSPKPKETVCSVDYTRKIVGYKDIYGTKVIYETK